MSAYKESVYGRTADSKSPWSPQKHDFAPDQSSCAEVLDRFGIPQHVSRRDYRFVEDLDQRTPKKGYQNRISNEGTSIFSRPALNVVSQEEYMEKILSPSNANAIGFDFKAPLTSSQITEVTRRQHTPTKSFSKQEMGGEDYDLLVRREDEILLPNDPNRKPVVRNISHRVYAKGDRNPLSSAEVLTNLGEFEQGKYTAPYEAYSNLGQTTSWTPKKENTRTEAERGFAYTGTWSSPYKPGRADQTSPAYDVTQDHLLRVNDPSPYHITTTNTRSPQSKTYQYGDLTRGEDQMIGHLFTRPGVRHSGHLPALRTSQTPTIMTSNFEQVGYPKLMEWIEVKKTTGSEIDAPNVEHEQQVTDSMLGLAQSLLLESKNTLAQVRAAQHATPKKRTQPIASPFKESIDSQKASLSEQLKSAPKHKADSPSKPQAPARDVQRSPATPQPQTQQDPKTSYSGPGFGSASATKPTFNQVEPFKGTQDAGRIPPPPPLPSMGGFAGQGDSVAPMPSNAGGKKPEFALPPGARDSTGTTPSSPQPSVLINPPPPPPFPTSGWNPPPQGSTSPVVASQTVPPPPPPFGLYNQPPSAPKAVVSSSPDHQPGFQTRSYTVTTSQGPGSTTATPPPPPPQLSSMVRNNPPPGENPYAVTSTIVTNSYPGKDLSTSAPPGTYSEYSV